MSSRSCLSLSRDTRRYRVSITLPFLSNRKHSVRAVLDRRRLSLHPTRSFELHGSGRLASGEGGARARLDATWAHTASIIGSKTGTATPPPVEPLPRVRRRPPALS